MLSTVRSFAAGTIAIHHEGRRSSSASYFLSSILYCKVKMHTILISLSSVITLISAASLHRGKSVWQASNFNSLVTFGDSYTDENGLNFYGMDNYSSSAAGIFLPETFSAPSGGRTWPRYVVQYTGQTTNGQWDPSMTLYNYAISGAVCSNEITPRYSYTNSIKAR